MNYPFRASANRLAKLLLALLGVFVLGAGTLATGFYHSPYYTNQGIEVTQPIAFSHRHHVQALGLDCRYCHTSVETSEFAGMPDSATCYGCHSQVWSQSEMLKPVRDSFTLKKPLVWNKVVKLPDYVYFNHQIHIAKGIGCVSCHGNIGQMNSVVQVKSFLMKDCISCHESPEKNVRPADEITNENYLASAHTAENLKAVHDNGVHPLQTTNCSFCHR